MSMSSEGEGSGVRGQRRGGGTGAQAGHQRGDLLLRLIQPRLLRPERRLNRLDARSRLLLKQPEQTLRLRRRVGAGLLCRRRARLRRLRAGFGLADALLVAA